MARLECAARVTVALTLLAACSKHAAPGATGNAPEAGARQEALGAAPPAAHDCKSTPPCTILTAADVNRSFGTTYAQGSGAERMSSGEAQCLYSGGGLDVRLQLLCTLHELTPTGRATLRQVSYGRGYSCTPVHGVGDDASWCTPTPDGGMTVLGDTLVFYVGSVEAALEIQAKAGGPHGANRVPTNDPRPAAEPLAKALAGKL